MLELRSVLAAGIVFLLGGVGMSANAQDIVIDWATKKLIEYPTQVNRRMSVTVLVRNVNDVLYSYTVDIQAIPRQQNDFEKISVIWFPSPSLTLASATEECPQALAKAQGAVKKVKEEIGKDRTKNYLIEPEKKDRRYVSVPLEKTLDVWAKNVQPHVAEAERNVRRLQKPDCANTAGLGEFLGAYVPFQAVVSEISRNIKSDHQVHVGTALRPEHDYKIVVTEKFDGEVTKDGVREFVFSPTSNVLTLSAGPLISTIQNRSYVPRSVPGQMENVLAVEGTSSVRPVLGALLNYRLPIGALDRDDFGLAVSSGLVLQFNGGDSGVSNIGFFSGLSFHLWNRLFITPGVHVGEFADFPVGFSSPGQTIPPNFGELLPVKRWTAHFGIAITFKTADFGKFASKPKTQKPDDSK